MEAGESRDPRPPPAPASRAAGAHPVRAVWVGAGLGPRWKPVTSSLRNGEQGGTTQPPAPGNTFLLPVPGTLRTPCPSTQHLLPSCACVCALPPTLRDGAPHPSLGRHTRSRVHIAEAPSAPPLGRPYPSPHSPHCSGTNAWLLSLLLSCPVVHGQSWTASKCTPSRAPPATPCTRQAPSGFPPHVCARTPGRPERVPRSLPPLLLLPLALCPLLTPAPAAAPSCLVLPQGLCTRPSRCLHCSPP